MSDKSTREQLDEIAETIREIRDHEVADELRNLRAEVEKLRAERGAHHCHGCSCTHVHWTYPTTWPYTGTVTYPMYQVTCGSGTAVGGTSGYIATNTAALGN